MIFRRNFLALHQGLKVIVLLNRLCNWRRSVFSTYHCGLPRGGGGGRGGGGAARNLNFKTSYFEIQGSIWVCLQSVCNLFYDGTVCENNSIEKVLKDPKNANDNNTAQKMKFSIKDFFLRIWSHLLKKSLMENLIFCAVRFTESFNVCFTFEILQSFGNVKLTLWYLLINIPNFFFEENFLRTYLWYIITRKRLYT